ncbi:MAG: T9SS type A sorting domain-containing protein [Bacteroidetes bacterium]|nr:T9SS type A sorting domain-containing protein [Bacteroidota bacterium]
MKKIFILLVVIINVHLTSISQQITVTNTDMPSTGNMINKSTALTAGSIDYTLTGANYSWDFSSLTPISQSIDTFVTVSSTSIFYYPTFILSADQALKQANINLGVAQMSNVYNFYKNSSSAYNLVGYAAQINGIPLPLKYNTADRLYKFPLNYGNIDSSSSVATIDVASIGYFNETKKRKNTVDGWGTLTTPYGTFPVLRLKSVIYQRDSLSLDTIPFPMPAVIRNITEYKWVGKNNGIPLLEIVETSFGVLPAFTTTINYIDSVRDLTPVGIEKISTVSESETIKVFPNPAINKFTISYTLNKSSEVDIRLYDLTGKEVKIIEKGFIEKGSYQQTYNVLNEKLIKGIYFIKFKLDKNTYSKKLVII